MIPVVPRISRKVSAIEVPHLQTRVTEIPSTVWGVVREVCSIYFQVGVGHEIPKIRIEISSGSFVAIVVSEVLGVCVVCWWYVCVVSGIWRVVCSGVLLGEVSFLAAVLWLATVDFASFVRQWSLLDNVFRVGVQWKSFVVLLNCVVILIAVLL